MKEKPVSKQISVRGVATEDENANRTAVARPQDNTKVSVNRPNALHVRRDASRQTIAEKSKMPKSTSMADQKNNTKHVTQKPRVSTTTIAPKQHRYKQSCVTTAKSENTNKVTETSEFSHKIVKKSDSVEPMDISLTSSSGFDDRSDYGMACSTDEIDLSISKFKACTQSIKTASSNDQDTNTVVNAGRRKKVQDRIRHIPVASFHHKTETSNNDAASVYGMREKSSTSKLKDTNAIKTQHDANMLKTVKVTSGQSVGQRSKVNDVIATKHKVHDNNVRLQGKSHLNEQLISPKISTKSVAPINLSKINDTNENSSLTSKKSIKMKSSEVGRVASDFKSTHSAPSGVKSELSVYDKRSYKTNVDSAGNSKIGIKRAGNTSKCLYGCDNKAKTLVAGNTKSTNGADYIIEKTIKSEADVCDIVNLCDNGVLSDRSMTDMNDREMSNIKEDHVDFYKEDGPSKLPEDTIDGRLDHLHVADIVDGCIDTSQVVKDLSMSNRNENKTTKIPSPAKACGPYKAKGFGVNRSRIDMTKNTNTNDIRIKKCSIIGDVDKRNAERNNSSQINKQQSSILTKQSAGKFAKIQVDRELKPQTDKSSDKYMGSKATTNISHVLKDDKVDANRALKSYKPCQGDLNKDASGMGRDLVMKEAGCGESIRSRGIANARQTATSKSSLVGNKHKSDPEKFNTNKLVTTSKKRDVKARSVAPLIGGQSKGGLNATRNDTATKKTSNMDSVRLNGHKQSVSMKNAKPSSSSIAKDTVVKYKDKKIDGVCEIIETNVNEVTDRVTDDIIECNVSDSDILGKLSLSSNSATNNDKILQQLSNITNAVKIGSSPCKLPTISSRTIIRSDSPVADESYGRSNRLAVVIIEPREESRAMFTSDSVSTDQTLIRTTAAKASATHAESEMRTVSVDETKPLTHATDDVLDAIPSEETRESSQVISDGKLRGDMNTDVQIIKAIKMDEKHEDVVSDMRNEFSGYGEKDVYTKSRITSAVVSPMYDTCDRPTIRSEIRTHKKKQKVFSLQKGGILKVKSPTATRRKDRTAHGFILAEFSLMRDILTEKYNTSSLTLLTTEMSLPLKRFVGRISRKGNMHSESIFQKCAYFKGSDKIIFSFDKDRSKLREESSTVISRTTKISSVSTSAKSDTYEGKLYSDNSDYAALSNRTQPTDEYYQLYNITQVVDLVKSAQVDVTSSVSYSRSVNYTDNSNNEQCSCNNDKAINSAIVSETEHILYDGEMLGNIECLDERRVQFEESENADQIATIDKTVNIDCAYNDIDKQSDTGRGEERVNDDLTTDSPQTYEYNYNRPRDRVISTLLPENEDDSKRLRDISCNNSDGYAVAVSECVFHYVESNENGYPDINHSCDAVLAKMVGSHDDEVAYYKHLNVPRDREITQTSEYEVTDLVHDERENVDGILAEEQICEIKDTLCVREAIISADNTYSASAFEDFDSKYIDIPNIGFVNARSFQIKTTVENSAYISLFIANELVGNLPECNVLHNTESSTACNELCVAPIECVNSNKLITVDIKNGRECYSDEIPELINHNNSFSNLVVTNSDSEVCDDVGVTEVNECCAECYGVNTVDTLFYCGNDSIMDKGVDFSNTRDTSSGLKPSYSNVQTLKKAFQNSTEVKVKMSPIVSSTRVAAIVSKFCSRFECRPCLAIFNDIEPRNKTRENWRKSLKAVIKDMKSKPSDQYVSSPCCVEGVDNTVFNLSNAPDSDSRGWDDITRVVDHYDHVNVANGGSLEASNGTVNALQTVSNNDIVERKCGREEQIQNVNAQNQVLDDDIDTNCVNEHRPDTINNDISFVLKDKPNILLSDTIPDQGIGKIGDYESSSGHSTNIFNFNCDISIIVNDGCNLVNQTDCEMADSSLSDKETVDNSDTEDFFPVDVKARVKYINSRHNSFSCGEIDGVSNRRTSNTPLPTCENIENVNSAVINDDTNDLDQSVLYGRDYLCSKVHTDDIQIEQLYSNAVEHDVDISHSCFGNDNNDNIASNNDSQQRESIISSPSVDSHDHADSFVNEENENSVFEVNKTETRILENTFVNEVIESTNYCNRTHSDSEQSTSGTLKFNADDNVNEGTLLVQVDSEQNIRPNNELINCNTYSDVTSITCNKTTINERPLSLQNDVNATSPIFQIADVDISETTSAVEPNDIDNYKIHIFTSHSFNSELPPDHLVQDSLETHNLLTRRNVRSLKNHFERSVFVDDQQVLNNDQPVINNDQPVINNDQPVINNDKCDVIYKQHNDTKESVQFNNNSDINTNSDDLWVLPVVDSNLVSGPANHTFIPEQYQMTVKGVHAETKYNSGCGNNDASDNLFDTTKDSCEGIENKHIDVTDRGIVMSDCLKNVQVLTSKNKAENNTGYMQSSGSLSEEGAESASINDSKATSDSRIGIPADRITVSPPRKLMTFQANKFVVQATVQDLFPFLDRNLYMPGSCGSPNRHAIEIVSASPNVGAVQTPAFSQDPSQRLCEIAADDVSMTSAHSCVTDDSHRSKVSRVSHERVEHESTSKRKSAATQQNQRSFQSHDTKVPGAVNDDVDNAYTRNSCDVNSGDNFESLIISEDFYPNNDIEACYIEDEYEKTDVDYMKGIKGSLPSIFEVNSPEVKSEESPVYQSTTLPRYKPPRIQCDPGTHDDLSASRAHPYDVTPALHGARRPRPMAHKTCIAPPIQLLQQPDYHSKRLRAVNQTLAFSSTPQIPRESLKIDELDEKTFSRNVDYDTVSDNVSFNALGHVTGEDMTRDYSAIYLRSKSCDGSAPKITRTNSNEFPADNIRHFVLQRKCSSSSISSDVLSPCDETVREIFNNETDLTPASSLDTLFDDGKTFVAKPAKCHRNMSFKKAQCVGAYKSLPISSASAISETASKVQYSGSGEALAENPVIKSGLLKRMIRRHKSLNEKRVQNRYLSASTENLPQRDPLFKLPLLKSLFRRGSRDLIKPPSSLLSNFRRGSKESLTSLTEDSDLAPIARFCLDSDIEKAPGSPRTPFNERKILRRSLTTSDVVAPRRSYVSAISDENSMIMDDIVSKSSDNHCPDTVSIMSTEISDCSLEVPQSVRPPLPSSLKPSPRRGTLGRRHTLVDSILDRRKHDSSPTRDDAAKREITTSYSNDSGIQRDSSLYSSNESFRIVSGAVVRRPTRLRPERPKSDVSPRWSQLFEEIWLKGNHHGNGPVTTSSDHHVHEGDFGSFERSLLLRHPEAQQGRKLRSSLSVGTIAGASDMLNLHHLSKQMSTPHPVRLQVCSKQPSAMKRKVRLQRSASLPENLEKLRKRRRITSYFGFDAAGNYCSPVDYSDESCNESEMFSDEQTKYHNARNSHINLSLSTGSQDSECEETVSYAEALWDHITLDPEELGFRAGDEIEVTDQTDKDWWWGVVDEREGWFPAGFVRLRVNQDVSKGDAGITGVDSGQREVDSWRRLNGQHSCTRRQARCNVVNEIMQAEREYVKHLKDVVEGYIVTVRRQADMFSEERTLTIFGNLEEIYEFSSDFLFQLEKVYDTTDASLSDIGECFLNNARKFEIYSDYCNNHPRSGDELQQLYRNKKYRHFFEACRLLQDMIEIPLEGFLLTPIQKICKYPLQLSELLKYTDSDHPDHPNVCHALEAMKRIARLINERKRKMENIEKISSWQSTVENWEGADLLEHSSELIYAGEVQKVNSSGWSQDRSIFLFDHQLVYCKKDLLKRNVYVYKGRISLDYCQVIPLNDGRDPQFNTTIRNAWKVYDKSRDRCYLFCGKTPGDKVRWLKALRDERQLVMDDQENDIVIASKWKRPYRASQKARYHLEKPSKGKMGSAILGRPISISSNLPSPVSKFHDPMKPVHQQTSSSRKPWSLFGGGKKSKT